MDTKGKERAMSTTEPNPPIVITQVPYSAEAVKNYVAIEREHIKREKFPELSCGCDRDDEEVETWTEEDYYAICVKCTNEVGSFSDDTLVTYFGEILYPCAIVTNARATVARDTRIAVALILEGEGLNG